MYNNIQSNTIICKITYGMMCNNIHDNDIICAVIRCINDYITIQYITLRFDALIEQNN